MTKTWLITGAGRGTGRLVIGPTPGGRMITVVVDRDSDDHGRWHVMTAWDATPAQVALYRKAR